VESWRKQYHRDYTFIGRMIGHYYDLSGNPTQAWHDVQKQLKIHEEAENAKKQEDLRYPRCNTKWTQVEGSEVWCSTNSGGTVRDWVGVPRELQKPGNIDGRCACVQLPDSNPLLKPYPGCDADAVRCKRPK